MTAPSTGLRIGIDLGGTKIEGVVLDADLAVPVRIRRPTPTSKRYDDILSALVTLVADLETKVGASGISVGMGTPGTVSPSTGLIKNSNTLSLNGSTLREDLSTRLEREVRIANDADCFAVSEATDGAAVGHRVVFGVILGTGVGGGVVVDGRPLAGPNGLSGEWGHTRLEADGPECYCGERGCVETLLSGPGFAADFARHGGSGEMDGPAIVAAAADGDASSSAALDRYVNRFGRALATVVNVLDPDVIVLGGGLSSIDALIDRGPDAVRRAVFGREFLTPIVRNRHGGSSGVRGAAMLWPADRGATC